MWRLILSQHPLTAGTYRRLQGRPPWVLKTAFLAAVLVLVIPLVVIVTSALLVGALVFAVLSLAASAHVWLREAVRRLRQGTPGNGRQNVRVIDPD